MLLGLVLLLQHLTNLLRIHSSAVTGKTQVGVLIGFYEIFFSGYSLQTQGIVSDMASQRGGATPSPPRLWSIPNNQRDSSFSPYKRNSPSASFTKSQLNRNTLLVNTKLVSRTAAPVCLKHHQTLPAETLCYIGTLYQLHLVSIPRCNQSVDTFFRKSRLLTALCWQEFGFFGISSFTLPSGNPSYTEEHFTATSGQ